MTDETRSRVTAMPQAAAAVIDLDEFRRRRRPEAAPERPGRPAQVASPVWVWVWL